MPEIDEQIREAMRQGRFADLPGKGKPLKLDGDAHVPEQMRMAHKLMRDNDLVPEWMAQGKELEAEREKLRDELSRLLHRGEGRSLEALREAAKKYNSRVLSYNLKVPQGVVHRRFFDVDGELVKLR